MLEIVESTRPGRCFKSVVVHFYELEYKFVLLYLELTWAFVLIGQEKQSQRPWPKEEIWSFEKPIKVVGSPMLDAVLHNAPLDKELVHWLKHRLPIFHAKWDR